MLKKNNLIKVLSLTSILFILFLVFNFTAIYEEKLPDVTDVIEEILQDENNKITKVKHLDINKYIIVGYTENADDTAGSWIKIIDKGEIIENEFSPEQDNNVLRKVLRCAILDKDGNYLLGGNQKKKGEAEKAWLLSLDQEGKIIGKENNIYGDKYFASEFKAITLRKEEGYILVGWKCDDKVKYDKKDFDPWVISVDSEFIEEEKEKNKVSFIKKDTKDIATNIVSVTSGNPPKTGYVIAIKNEKEKNNSIRLIKISDDLVKIGEEKEINLSGKGGIYYITEDNEDGFILVGHDSDIKNNDNPTFLWVKKFSNIDKEYEEWEYEEWEYEDDEDNRFIYGVEKDNENYFNLISYPQDFKMPLYYGKMKFTERDIEGETVKERTETGQIVEPEEKEGIEEESEEEITEPEETTFFDKIKENIKNNYKLYLLILLSLILILLILYFAKKSQKKEKVNQIKYTNFSLGRIEEIESLLKRIQIELKKELYEAEQLNNFSYKQRLKEIKTKFTSVAKKYKNKDVDLLVIQNQLDALLKEIYVFIR